MTTLDDGKGPLRKPVSATGSMPLDDLRGTASGLATRLCVWGPGALVLSFLIWSSWAELDEVAVAIGEVIPQQQVQIVQHLEGGVIESIQIAEGDIVSKGQVMMQLNLGGASLNREELAVRLDGLLLTKARLEAEAEGIEAGPVFPSEIAEARADLAAAEMRNYQGRKRDLESTLSILDERTRQRTLEVAELEAHLTAVKRDLTLGEQRLAMSADLLKEGLTPRMDHVSIESEVEKLRGEISVMQQSVPRAKAALQETEAERVREIDAFRRRALEELVPIETRIAELRGTLETATDQALRAEIRSPIDGVVKNLITNTVGGVIRPGEGIAEIVPISNDLEILARLDPKDRGFVAKGQKALVKVTTYDYARYGGLEGVVERVGATTSVGARGESYYEVVVRTDKTYLGAEEGDFPITPGMETTVDIHTGTRTVLDYLVKPVLKLQHEAFRER